MTHPLQKRLKDGDTLSCHTSCRVEAACNPPCSTLVPDERVCDWLLPDLTHWNAGNRQARIARDSHDRSVAPMHIFCRISNIVGGGARRLACGTLQILAKARKTDLSKPRYLFSYQHRPIDRDRLDTWNSLRLHWIAMDCTEKARSSEKTTFRFGEDFRIANS